MTEIYYRTGRQAHDAGELDLYRASLAENKRTRAAIDDAISRHFDGCRLAPAALGDVLRDCDRDRVALVLAWTVRARSGDGRFSLANRAWAEGVRIPEEDPEQIAFHDPRMVYECQSHSAILDGYVRMYRTWREAVV